MWKANQNGVNTVGPRKDITLGVDNLQARKNDKPPMEEKNNISANEVPNALAESNHHSPSPTEVTMTITSINCGTKITLFGNNEEGKSTQTTSSTGNQKENEKP